VRDLVVAQPEALAGAGPERLDDDVGARTQRARQAQVVGLLEVEGHRALVAVEGQVVGGALVDERRTPGARVVAAVGPLDLDHLGAQIAERHGAQRPGQDAREVGHEDPVQRGSGHGRAG
jgi:hypothetical protein